MKRVAIDDFRASARFAEQHHVGAYCAVRSSFPRCFSSVRCSSFRQPLLVSAQLVSDRLST